MGSVMTKRTFLRGGGGKTLLLTLALLALVTAALAAITAADFTTAQAQIDDEATGRIVAQRLEDGRVEFGWQPTGGSRVLPRQRYFPTAATVDRWLRSSPVEVDGAAIGRISARLLSDGRIEFAFTPTDGERITPQARYFPADARVGRWLRSTEIAIGPAALRYTAVSAGWFHTCGLRESGAIECWGWNDDGQTDAPDGRFTAISVNGVHTCAIRESGEIACWGDNFLGQTDAPDGRFTAISVSGVHTCAIRESDSAITCWGANSFRTPLQNDIKTGQIDAPEGSFTAVSAGNVHTCGLRDTGEIACWGRNDGFTSEGYPYVTGRTDAPDGRFTAVSAAWKHTCGLRESGAIECWGDWGDLDAGQTDAPEGSYTAISAGTVHTCAIRAGSGAIDCWGANGYRSWDPETEVEAYVETGQIDAPDGRFTAVSAGSYHTCGLRESGAIECWVWNDNGQATPPTD